MIDIKTQFPESWVAMALSDAVSNITITNKKIPQKEYLSEGLYPIFDQAQHYISGYTDKKENLVDCELPVIVFGDHTRIIKYVNRPFAPGADGVKILQPQRFYNSRLFEYFTRHIVTYLTNNGYARHYQYLAKSTIPLPPLPEQHRIVAKIEELLSELDKGIENLKISHAQLKVYRQALLKHAFEGKLTAKWRAENQDKLETAGSLLKRIQLERAQRYLQQLADWEAAGRRASKPKAPKTLLPLTAEELAELPELPLGWGWAKVAELASKITDGEHLRPTVRDDGIFFLSAKDVQSNGVAFNDPLFIDEDTAAKARLRCDPERNDILIVSRGATVGRMCIVDTDKVFCLLGSVILIKVLNLVRSSYFLFCLRSPLINKKITAVSGATAQQAIYLRDIQHIPIPLCSPNEQLEISKMLDEKLSNVYSLEVSIDAELLRSQALRQSILKKAFSGQLVPQDPHDEPASALLARIKAEKSGHLNNKKARI